MMDRSVLSDAAWERVAPLIIGRPDQKGSTGHGRSRLGCPVRSALTGVRRDAPQAAALIEGYPPRSSGPIRYDAEHLR